MPDEIEVGKISVGLGINDNDLQNKADKAVEALENIVAAADKAKPEIKPKYDIRPLNNAQNAFDKLNDKIEDNKAKTGEAETSETDYKKALDKSRKSTDDLDGSTEKLNQSFSTAKIILADLISSGIKKGSSAILDIGKDILRTGENFTSTMSEVKAISGASGEELEKIRQAARQFGAETVFSASESAQAFKFMALAGWDAEKSIAAVPGVLALAAASGMSLGQAADMVTDYLSAYNMTAEQAAYLSDLLTYAQGHSNTSAQQLGEAWKNCAANLNAAGQDVETVTSILEAMANQGYKGSEAGTSLSAIMRDITDKMKNGSISIGEINVAVRDAEGNFRDLTDILADIEKAVDGMGTAEKSAALSTTFTQDSIKGLNLVLNEGIGKVRGYEDALRQSMGSADSAAQIMSDNLTGDIKILESALDDLKLGIYDGAEQPIRKVVQAITRDGVPALKALLDNIDKIIPVVLTAAVAMGSYKASLAVQSIIKGVQQGLAALSVARAADTAATQAETSAQIALNTAQAANPIGLLVAAVGGLAAGIGALTLINNSAAESTRNYNEELKQLKDTADQTVANAEGEANVISALSDRYEELRTKQDKTKADEQELIMLSEQLAEKLGVTTDSLKEQNGEYKSLADNVQAYSEKLIIQAKMEAAAEMIRQATIIKMKAKWEEDEKFFELVKKGIYKENGDINHDKWGEDEAGVIKLRELSDATRSATKAVDEYTQQYQELIKEFAKFKTESNDTTTVVEAQTESFEKETTITETVSEKYERLNKLLEENKKAVENVNNEIEQAMDNGDEEHLKKLQDELKNLNSEQTTLQNRIKAVKEEIDKDSKAVISAVENVESSAQMLAKAQKEVDDNGKLSLSTLLQIQKKYPELVDSVNDYISGVKTEKDIIKELKDVYESDAEIYNKALTAKLLKQNDFAQGNSESVVELVNNLKDQYGIDVQNFANAAEVKKAALESLKAKAEETQKVFNEFWAENNFDVGMSNGSMYYMVKDPRTNQWRNATQDEIARYKAIAEARNKAYDDYYSFDTNGVQKYMDLYKSVSAGAGVNRLLDLSGTGSDKSNSGNSKSKTETENRLHRSTYKGQEYTEIYSYEKGHFDAVKDADAEVKAILGVIDRAKNLGKVTLAEEIYNLEKLLERERISADQRYDIENRLYQAKEKLRSDEISALDKLEDAVTAALKNKYEEQKQLEEKRIDASISAWKKWEEETVGAVQGQIQALDDLKNAHEEETNAAEYENKRKALELEKRYAKDDFNRKEIDKQIALLDKAENERLFNARIEEQKKLLNDQINAAHNLSDSNQTNLNEYKQDLTAKYSELINSKALQSEAEKYILNHSQSDIATLINSYAKDYDLNSSKLSDVFYNGFKQKINNVLSFTDRIASSTDTVSERTNAANLLNNYLSGSSDRDNIINNRSVSASSAASKINSFIKGFSETLNNISSSALLRKNDLAFTANSAADRYYQTQKTTYYQSNKGFLSNDKTINVYMTVNFNEKVDSPIKVKREMENIGYDIAKQIAG